MRKIEIRTRRCRQNPPFEFGYQLSCRVPRFRKRSQIREFENGNRPVFAKTVAVLRTRDRVRIMRIRNHVTLVIMSVHSTPAPEPAGYCRCRSWASVSPGRRRFQFGQQGFERFAGRRGEDRSELSGFVSPGPAASANRRNREPRALRENPNHAGIRATTSRFAAVGRTRLPARQASP